MKKKVISPLVFAMSSLVLTACGGGGGESANVKSEPNTISYVNGTCEGEDCVEFALDYPIDGINFTCSSNSGKTFVTLIEPTSNAATGKCRKDDKVNFFIQENTSKRIDLGQVALSDITTNKSYSSLPRISVLDMAKGLTNNPTNNLDLNDETTKVATALIKIFQGLSLETKAGIEGDIQPVYLTSSKKSQLDRILNSIYVADYKDGSYEAEIRPWVDVSQITNQEALDVLKKLVNMGNSAIYQASYPVLAIQNTQLPQGFYGCNRTSCQTNGAGVEHMIGQFILLTDRNGYTFGLGSNWKGSVTSSSENPIIGASSELLTKVRPVRMQANAQMNMINPLKNSITQPFVFNVGENTLDTLNLTQGRLYNDYLIAGSEGFYKLLTDKTQGNPTEYGQWKYNVGGSTTFNGGVDIYKTFPVTYLDNRVFKSVNSVGLGDKYIFPLHATLTFDFSGITKNAAKLGIVIDENGNIRTDINSQEDLSNACSTVTNANMVDNKGQQQYRIGVLGASDTTNNALTLRILLANPIFKDINGAAIGLNVNMATDPSGNTSTVVGGARVNVGSLLNGTDFISLTDFSGAGATWSNIYNSQLVTYVNQASNNASDADKELAKNLGGSVKMDVASACPKLASKIKM